MNNSSCFQSVLNIGLCGVLAGTVACGYPDKIGPSEAAKDASEALYAADHVVEVEVTLSPQDWEVLRREGRGVSALMGDVAPYDYTYFPATVTVDGVRHDNASVRKKGFLGSLSAIRPSLKVKLAADKDGPLPSVGARELTLNNDRQDPSHTHQCLAYRLYARAGLAAPRCNLARVVVNGEDLGTFSNVESLDKAFLARHFDDASGNLYEGQQADFLQSEVERIELKTNKKQGDRSDLQGVVEALSVPDGKLVSALSQVIDLESFRTSWALDVLMGNWDSYAGNANNYQAYHDPATDRFVFLPWGTDAAFSRVNPFDPVNRSIALYAKGIIARRLYALPEERERYRQRLEELNETLWNESELLGEVDQIASLAPDADPSSLDAQRELIRSQKEQLRAALTEPAPEWVPLEGAVSPCSGDTSAVAGNFTTIWGDLNVMTPETGPVAVNLSVDGTAIDAGWLGKAGVDPSSGLGTGPAIRLATGLPDGTVLSIHLQLPPNALTPGVIPFHGMETVGALVVVKDGIPRIVGFIGDGSITLEAGKTEDDAPVVGGFQGKLLQLGCMGQP